MEQRAKYTEGVLTMTISVNLTGVQSLESIVHCGRRIKVMIW